MRTPIIAGNWKMNLNIPAALDLSQTIVASVGKLPHPPQCEIILAPTTLALAKVRDVMSDILAQSRTKTSTKVSTSTTAEVSTTLPKFYLSAQDVHWEDDGAFTGKISATMLQSLDITHSLVGHSEQRQHFHETLETVHKKVKKLLTLGLTPILCIGETLAERRSGALEKVLQSQLQSALETLTPEEVDRLVIAYEPVWAIGTGVSATSQEAEEAHLLVRTLIRQLISEKTAAAIRILYGGSVKANNAKELLAAPNIDGALVGGASLQAESFVAIIEALA